MDAMADGQIAQQRTNDLKQKARDIEAAKSMRKRPLRMRRLMPMLLLHLKHRIPHLRLMCGQTHHHHPIPTQTLLPHRRHRRIRSQARSLRLSRLLCRHRRNRRLDFRRAMQHWRQKSHCGCKGSWGGAILIDEAYSPLVNTSTRDVSYWTSSPRWRMKSVP
ncbi:hypothetical protein M405DRAFT_121764 [Rhizopogon salebrosus TDB-379]|nr:hypothetical protein M405DRAFT_121764 [Rhizopogon salebrosus TDB-379]